MYRTPPHHNRPCFPYLARHEFSTSSNVNGRAVQRGLIFLSTDPILDRRVMPFLQRHPTQPGPVIRAWAEREQSPTKPVELPRRPAISPHRTAPRTSSPSRASMPRVCSSRAWCRARPCGTTRPCDRRTLECARARLRVVRPAVPDRQRSIFLSFVKGCERGGS
jgi:hypothetical protein